MLIFMMWVAYEAGDIRRFGNSQIKFLKPQV